MPDAACPLRSRARFAWGRPPATRGCPGDRLARRLVARLAALRVGGGLRPAGPGSEAARAPSGEAAAAHASFCVHRAGPGWGARHYRRLAWIRSAERARALSAAAVFRGRPAALSASPAGRRGFEPQQSRAAPSLGGSGARTRAGRGARGAARAALVAASGSRARRFAAVPGRGSQALARARGARPGAPGLGAA